MLTFNYDRLFEIAFLKFFQSFNLDQSVLYAKEALNSGFSDRVNGGYGKVELASGGFCFLKLHGSTGWWVRKRKGNRSNAEDELRLYWPAIPTTAANVHDIETRLQEKGDYPWEPLIAFPHEKQRATSRNTDFSWNPYIREIEKHAASVLASATAVRIIGYSFAPIDSRHVVSNLLSEVPERAKMLVQNTDIARVRSRLEAYSTLKGRLEFDPTPF